MLIGFGRWGSSDPWLGIPVNWSMISGVGVIIEASLQGRPVDMSQGSHFFHNLVALNIGYLNIPYHHKGESFINWDFLQTMKIEEKREFFTHVARDNPFTILMDGKNGNAVILK